MKNLAYLVLISTLLFSFSAGQARNTIQQFSIEKALARGEAEGKLNSSVHLYFGNQPHPPLEGEYGHYESNKKTNAFNKSDEDACQWAFLSAIISLQNTAIRHGGNAVVNIRSFYYKNNFSSETEFECGAGNTVAGVTMVGEIAKIAD